MEMNSYIDLLIGLVMAMGAWWCKTQQAELHRITVLLNRTREEIAKEYVTKVEVHADINRIIDRLEALDAKLDRIMEKR